MAAKIPALRRYNARGFDVYVTPISDAHHYLVLDDARSATAQKIMREDAVYAPCLVQKSSDDNYQVVMKVPKDTRPDEQAIANSFITKLNTTDGDEFFHGAIHGFRMAGFSNKKKDRDNEFTTILVAANRLSPYAATALTDGRTKADADLVEKAKEAERLATEKEQTRRVQCILEPVHDAKASRGYGSAYYDKRYIETAQGYVKQYGAAANWSAIDYRCGVAIVAHGGGDIADAMSAIRRNSPHLADRHGDTESYLQKTEAAILANDEVVKEQELTKTRQQRVER